MNPIPRPHQYRCRPDERHPERNRMPALARLNRDARRSSQSPVWISQDEQAACPRGQTSNPMNIESEPDAIQQFGRSRTAERLFTQLDTSQIITREVTGAA